MNTLVNKQTSEIDAGKAIAAILASGLPPEKIEEILMKLTDENCNLGEIQTEINQLQQQKKQDVQAQSGQQAQTMGESWQEQMVLYTEAYEQSGDEWDQIVNEGIGNFIRNAARGISNTVKDAASEFGGNRREKSNNKFYYNINQEIRGVSRDIAEMCEDLKTMGVNLDTHPEIKQNVDNLIGAQNGIIGNTGAQMGGIQKLRYGAGKMIAGAAYNAAAFALLGHVLPVVDNPIARGAMKGAAASVLRDLRTGQFYKKGEDGKDTLDVRGILTRMAKGAAIGGAVQFGVQKAMQELGLGSPSGGSGADEQGGGELGETGGNSGNVDAGAADGTEATPNDPGETYDFKAADDKFQGRNLNAQSVRADAAGDDTRRILSGENPPGWDVNDDMAVGAQNDPVFGNWLNKNPDKLRALRDALQKAQGENPTMNVQQTYAALAKAVKGGETKFDAALQNIGKYVVQRKTPIVTDDAW